MEDIKYTEFIGSIEEVFGLFFVIAIEILALTTTTEHHMSSEIDGYPIYFL